MDFWFDRGVGGFRIDALQALFFDREFRDNPGASPDDTDKERGLQQRFAFNANRPEVHEVIRRWRTLADGYDPPRLLFGETWVPTVERLAEYYGNGSDELHLAWNLPFLASRFQASHLEQTIRRTIQALPTDAVPTWAISTHDGEGRAASRWCGGEDAAIRCALVVLLGLEGTSILYYGDEIGMLEPSLEELNADQPHPAEARFASRTPMQWDHGAGGGFFDGSTMVAGRRHRTGERRRPAERSGVGAASLPRSHPHSYQAASRAHAHDAHTARRARVALRKCHRGGQPWSEQM